MSLIDLQAKQREIAGKRQELDQRITTMSNAPEAERRAFQMPETGELHTRNAEIKSMTDALQMDSDMVSYQERNRAEMKSALAPERSGMWGSGGSGVERADIRTTGQKFVESPAYLQRGGDTRITPIETSIGTASIKSWQLADEESAIKATLTTAAGYLPFLPRTGRVVELGQIKPVIADFITQTQTEVPGGRYMEETLYQNNAGIVPEGTTKPEAALAFVERQFGMQKIAVNLPVTDEQLSDVPQIRGIIDNRLGLMVRQSEDGYLLNNTVAGGGRLRWVLAKDRRSKCASGGAPSGDGGAVCDDASRVRPRLRAGNGAFYEPA